MVNCPNCGRENADHFNFCLDCGTELAKNAAPPQPAASSPAPATSPAVPAVAQPAPQTAPSMAASSSLPPPPSVFTAPPPVAPSPASPFGNPQTPLNAAVANPAILPPPTAFGSVRTEVGAGGIARPSPAQHTPTAAAFNATPLASPVIASAPSTGSSTSNVSMGQVCPNCQAPVPAGMRFCGSCGTKLDPSAPGPSAPPSAAVNKTQFMHVADVAALVQPKARLIVIDQQGKEGTSYTIKQAETSCGRTSGVIQFFDDQFVSPNHCTFRFNAGKLSVKDNGSLNGVFVRLRAELEVQNQDIIRMGRQLMRVELELPAEPSQRAPDDDSRLWGTPDPKPFGRLVQLLEDGRTGEVRLLRPPEMKLGREIGDVVFPQDGFVSGQHCVFSQRAARVFLRDVGSSNGTYVRIRGEKDLNQDDFVLIGNQLLRVDLR